SNVAIRSPPPKQNWAVKNLSLKSKPVWGARARSKSLNRTLWHVLQENCAGFMTCANSTINYKSKPQPAAEKGHLKVPRDINAIYTEDLLRMWKLHAYLIEEPSRPPPLHRSPRPNAADRAMTVKHWLICVSRCLTVMAMMQPAWACWPPSWASPNRPFTIMSRPKRKSSRAR